MTVTLNTETIGMVTLFENITGASVKDCIVDSNIDAVYFIIEEGEVAKAIGKNGSSVKNAERIFKKNIKLFEFSKDLSTFVKRLIPQATGVRIRNENGKIDVEIKVEKKDRAMVIGRDGKNIKLFKELLQRNHGVSDLLVR